MKRGFIVALVGTESTGKTTLAEALRDALRRTDRRVAVVNEFLREFCDRAGRTPHRFEQRGIAEEQTRRIDAASLEHHLVIADTTALMTAVYSDWVFGDRSLYAAAEAAHACCDLTLLTAPDIAWHPDGPQRDGPQVREPIDALVRAALGRAGSTYAVVIGTGGDRLTAALASLERAMDEPSADATRRWQWQCERCGDAACERHASPRPATGSTPSPAK